MWVAIAGARMSSAIAKGVKLFDIAQRRAGLFRNPFAQTDVERSVPDGIKRSGRQSGDGFAIGETRRQDQGFVVPHGDDRCGQADLDRRRTQRLRVFGYSRRRQAISSAKGAPS
jgi:hypothetical protein